MTPFLGLLSPCPSDTFPISVHTGRCLSLSLCPFFMQFLSLPPSFTLIALVPIHSPLSAAAEGPNWKGGARATQAWKGREEREGGRERERRAKETWICYSWDMHWENQKEKGWERRKWQIMNGPWISVLLNQQREARASELKAEKRRERESERELKPMAFHPTVLALG